jgi:uracil-DNA glycosylase
MRLAKNWYEKLLDEITKPYFQDLKDFLRREEESGAAVFPKKSAIFYAFGITPFDAVNVVIMGQDPYHGPGQAHGMSFSVPAGVPPPPSLQNIFKELKNDVGILAPTTGCLTGWAKQGVLLLNATLTVRAGEPKSHQGRGWEQFTDVVIEKLAERETPLVFLLWGKSAQEKCERVFARTHHVVLTAPHPSPYSAHSGFFGCRHFSRANKWLKQWGRSPIDWQVQ